MLETKSIVNIQEDKNLVEFVLTTKNEREKNNAFAKLLNKYKYNILNNMRRLTKDELVAEDLLFETFQKAYEKLNTYNPRKKAFSTWLYTIAHNHAIDYLRTQKEFIESIDEDKHNNDFDTYKNELRSGCKTAMEKIAQKEMKEEIHMFIDKLTKEEFKQVIELRYFKEYAYEEIAFELNKPLNTVKVLIMRARKELQEIYKKYYKHDRHY